jgi:hypothetical protein
MAAALLLLATVAAWRSSVAVPFFSGDSAAIANNATLRRR